MVAATKPCPLHWPDCGGFDASPVLGRVRDRILAIDEGTTGVTALVLDAQAKVLGRAYREVAQSYPQPGWVEQDPLELVEAVRWAGLAAMRTTRTEPAQLAGIGLANQRETTVLWERRTGRPVAPAIVWQDRRTSARCAKLAGKAALIRRRTGLVPDPYFCATKLEWLLQDPELRHKAKRGDLAFGTIDSWLAFRLTGRHATDPTNASRTLLWDIHRGAWDDELLEMFNVPREVLPEVVPSAGVVGETKAFGSSVPVAALVGDQQAALVGQGCTRAGEAKATYGTGCFLLQHTGSDAVASRHGLLTTRAASTGKAAQFSLEGAVFSAGSALQWLRDQVGMVTSPQEIDALAGQVADAGGVHFVPAFTGLGAPYWDPDARAAILGVSRGSDKRHLARAALEAIAFQATELVLTMEKDSGRKVPQLRVDGGASNSHLLLQMQADLLQRPVARPANIETTAMGAGLLAGFATDLWPLTTIRRREDLAVVAPVIDAVHARKSLAGWRHAVATVRGHTAPRRGK